MNKFRQSILYSSVFLFTVSAVFLSFQSPYLFMSVGDSMEPTFSDCSIHITNPNVDEHDLHETDIIIYSNPNNTNIIHRIDTVEESFSTESKYKVMDGKFYIKHPSENVVTIYNSPMESSEDLYGETVYVTQGDNNESVDKYFVTLSDIHGVLVFTVELPQKFCQ